MVETPERAGRTVAIVIGPSTRLARALLPRLLGSERRVVLLTRSEREQSQIQVEWPDAEVVLDLLDVRTVGDEDTECETFVCALGPIHPGSAEFEKDSANALWVTTNLRRFWDQSGYGCCRTVFVSSVLSLCPRGDRRYYAGFKNVLEGILRQLADQRSGWSLAVLYPGRLTEARKPSEPASWLYSTYGELAERMLATMSSTRASRRLIGWDARLWLTLQTFLRIGRSLVGLPMN